MKKSGSLGDHLSRVGKNLESLYESQNQAYLKKGLSPSQAHQDAERLALDTYLPFPGTET